MNSTQDKKINEAENAIMRILADLERNTGLLVDSIGISDLDVTTFGDQRAQLIRKVTIEAKRTPGHRWATDE